MIRLKPIRLAGRSLFLLTLFLVACSSIETVTHSVSKDAPTNNNNSIPTTSNDSTSLQLEEVINQDWVLSSLTKEGVQKEPLAEIEISLRFSADGLSGSAGCNRYFAAYQTEGDNQLSITGIATTRTFCPQPAGVMVQEQDFVQLLSEVETYRICPDKLTLDANGQKHRLVFNKR